MPRSGKFSGASVCDRTGRKGDCENQLETDLARPGRPACGIHNGLEHNLLWFNHYIWGDPWPDIVHPVLPKKDSKAEAPKTY